MTREEYSRTLRYMESVRLASYEADTKREEQKLIREYGVLWKSIKLYANGDKEFDQ